MKKIFKCCLIFLFCSSFYIHIFAYDSVDNASKISLSIEDLFRLGLENSVRLRSSKLMVDLKSEQLKSAKRDRLPQIGIGLAGGYMGQPVLFTSGLANPTYPEAPRWKHDYEAQIVQPIYQGGSLSLNIEKEKIEHRLAQLMVEGDEQDIKLEYLRRYLDLFLLYKQCEVFERNIVRAEQRKRDIHNMYEEGLVTSNDEIRSDLQLTQYRLDKRTAEDNIKVISTTLDVLLDLERDLIIIPDTTFLLSVTAPLLPFEYYLHDASQNYPGMKVARENVNLLKVDVSMAKTDYIPKLNLVANYGLIRPLSSTLEDKFYQSWDVGLALTFNISAFYRNKVKEKKIGLTLQQYALEEEMQNLYIRINEAYSLHRQALDRIETLQLAVKEAKENYRIVNNRYMEQLSILTDLLDAESVLLDSELQLTGARVNAVYTYCQLLQACGKL